MFYENAVITSMNMLNQYCTIYLMPTRGIAKILWAWRRHDLRYSTKLVLSIGVRIKYYYNYYFFFISMFDKCFILSTIICITIVKSISYTNLSVPVKIFTPFVRYSYQNNTIYYDFFFFIHTTPKKG